MIITDIIEYDRKKVLVQLDGHFIFPLYKTEVNKFKLIKGEVISTKAYLEIMEQVLPKRVKLRAMKLLEKRSYTYETLKRKLMEGKYPEQFVLEALEYVSSFHYIDDLRYAEEYIRCYCEKKSKSRIFHDLMSKGVAREVIDNAWFKYESQNEPVDETTQIIHILEKKRFNPQEADYKEKAKMIRHLCSKGYSMNCIRKCMQFDEEYADL